MNKIPKHIAIIMDGNRRWAKKYKKPVVFGHKKGVDVLREIVRHAGEIGVEYLTVFAFSTENIGRSKMEVSALMSLFARALKEEVSGLDKNNVKLRFIGKILELPSNLQEEIKNAEKKLSLNTGLNLIVAVNYGSKTEIEDAARKGKIEENLYTKGIPDPDLIIRTGGMIRLSNFLLWQGAYAELYFSDILWPSFAKKDLDKAILDYNRRERRFGR